MLNCYAEQSGPEQKSDVQIWACDGLARWATIQGGGRIRAALDVDGVLYVVADRRIYSVDSEGHETDLGGIGTTGPVYMARNRRVPAQIAIVSDGIYQVIEAGTLTTIEHPIASPTSVDFVDGFFVFSHLDGRISHTESDDATTIDALAFGAVESSADPCTRVIESRREIIAFGTKSTEWFANVGTAPFAFQRTQTTNIGTIAPGSVARLDQTVLFVADDNTVRMLQGYSAPEISEHWVTRLIEDEPNRSEITAAVWRSKGHSFYCLNGTTFSICYDTKTGKWHHRKSYGLPRWRVSAVVEFNGQLIACDYAENLLYTMSDTHHDENEAPIECEIITPPAHGWPKRVLVHQFALDMVPGVGRNTYPSNVPNTLMWDEDELTWGGTPLAWGYYATPADVSAWAPKVMLQWSDDGGISWSAERTAEIGRMGETQKRIVFRRLGLSKWQGRVFKIRVTAAVMRGFLGAAVDAEAVAA